jgi:hypothetical protein
VASQSGFYVDPNVTGAANNFGFRSLIPSGANNWNLYMQGTAKNYLEGNTLIGTTTDSGYKLDVNGTFKTSGTNVLSDLAGTGTRMVVASSLGTLSTQGLGVESVDVAVGYPFNFNPTTGNVLFDTKYYQFSQIFSDNASPGTITVEHTAINNTGATYVWTSLGTGIYQLEFSAGIMDTTRTLVQVSGGFVRNQQVNLIYYHIRSAEIIEIYIFDETLAPADGLLDKASIDIKIFDK